METEDEQLTDEESVLEKNVDDAMSAISIVLDLAPGEPYTIDEISRLVYDPFPAPMRVTVPGEIVEREGYPGELKSRLHIPVFSIWSAFDLDAFLAIPRAAIENQLKPEPVYRVRWTPAEKDEAAWPFD